MGRGFTISVVAHAVALLGVLALFGSPRPYAPTPVDSIAVDLVSPQEAAPQPEPPAEPSLLTMQPRSEPGADTADTVPQESPPRPEAPQPPAVEQSPPAETQQQARAPEQPPPQQPPPQQPPPQQSPPQNESIFAPSRIQQLLDLTPPPGESTVATGPGVDAPAEKQADLSRDEVANLKTHLRRCWKQPPGLETSQRTRVVLRVFLKRDGALASEPQLVEASASRAGPPLVAAATRALRECQPFAFLPADRYDEWKILDIGFTPREMAGG